MVYSNTDKIFRSVGISGQFEYQQDLEEEEGIECAQGWASGY